VLYVRWNLERCIDDLGISGCDLNMANIVLEEVTCLVELVLVQLLNELLSVMERL